MDQNSVMFYLNIHIIRRKHTVRPFVQFWKTPPESDVFPLTGNSPTLKKLSELYRLANVRPDWLTIFSGTEIISSSGNHESIFLAESNLTEIESIISNDRSEKVFSSKSNLLINSWCYVAQIFIKIGKIAEANKCIDEIRAIGKG